MASAAKFVLPIPIFLAYLFSLDVEVTGKITAKVREIAYGFGGPSEKNVSPH
jgi:hypothetical protein